MNDLGIGLGVCFVFYSVLSPSESESTERNGMEMEWEWDVLSVASGALDFLFGFILLYCYLPLGIYFLDMI